MAVWLYQTRSVDAVLFHLGLFMALTTGFFLFRNSKQFQLVDGLQSIGRVTTEGKINQRHSRSLSWATVNGESKVFEKDMIFIPKDSTALVALQDGRSLYLDPGSLVEFDSFLNEQLPVILLSGSAKLVHSVTQEVKLLKPQTVSENFLIPRFTENLAGPLWVDPALWEHSQREIFTRIHSVNTESTALLEEMPLSPLKEEMDSLFDYDLTLAPPEEGQQKNNLEFWLSLKWSKIPLQGVQYVLELSRTADFGVVMTYQTPLSEIAIHLYESGKYFWRVTSVWKKQQIHSPVKSFLVNNALRKISSEPDS